jgi:hypothetical protein
MQLTRKHQATLDAIFATPVHAGIVWSDIEALFRACGAEISEGSGSGSPSMACARCFTGRIRRRRPTRAP